MTEQKLLELENLFEGKSKIWYHFAKYDHNTYEQFETAFLHEFYSFPISLRYKNRWSARRYGHKGRCIHILINRDARQGISIHL